MRPEVSSTRQRGHPWETGPPFRRWDGAPTRIDYIAIPKGLLNTVVEVKVLRGSAHRLANCAQLRDHQPLRVKVRYELWFSGLGDDVPRSGADADLMQGTGLKEFKEDVEWADKLVEKTEWVEARRGGDVQRMEKMLTKGIKQKAEAHFAKRGNKEGTG